MANMPMKKKTGGPVITKRGGGVAFRPKKKKKGVTGSTRSNPPKIGERKALRKRIVLSNPSALEVKGLFEMDKHNIKDTDSVGKVLILPGQTVDQLRAAQAFRKTQNWSLFHKPCMLVRKETVSMAEQMYSTGTTTMRCILTGDRGSGKSLMLLQAAAIAFQYGWVVISIPEAHALVNGSSDYRPAPNSKPVLYEQGQYAMETLRRIMAANASLKTMKLDSQHQLPTTLQAGASLFDLCDLGTEDVEIAPAILSALLKELDMPSRPSLLVTIDGLGHLMGNTAYKNPSFGSIHAHELALVDWMMSYLSGTKSFTNGGLIMAATSSSNDPKSETLSLRLRQMQTKQVLERNMPDSSTDDKFLDPKLPFLLATGQQPNPIPQPDPYFAYDKRVFEVLGSPFGVKIGDAGESKSSEVKIQSLTGMSKDEARGLMEYWANSGIMRQRINDRLVSEKWSLAGGGIIGELERSCVRNQM